MVRGKAAPAISTNSRSDQNRRHKYRPVVVLFKFPADSKRCPPTSKASSTQPQRCYPQPASPRPSTSPFTCPPRPSSSSAAPAPAQDPPRDGLRARHVRARTGVPRYVADGISFAAVVYWVCDRGRSGKASALAVYVGWRVGVWSMAVAVIFIYSCWGCLLLTRSWPGALARPASSWPERHSYPVDYAGGRDVKRLLLHHPLRRHHRLCLDAHCQP